MALRKHSGPIAAEALGAILHATNGERKLCAAGGARIRRISNVRKLVRQHMRATSTFPISVAEAAKHRRYTITRGHERNGQKGTKTQWTEGYHQLSPDLKL
jgi:hypothetical protein